MPAYSFKELFVPFILDGSKNQTIRTERKHQAKAGDNVYLYYAMRTKYCTFLMQAICKETLKILITRSGQVMIGERLLTLDEKNFLAWQDGFRPDGATAENPFGAFDLMLRWWRQTHELPFKGEIIYWHKGVKKLKGKSLLTKPAK
jgi:hypothetical protein